MADHPAQNALFFEYDNHIHRHKVIEVSPEGEILWGFLLPYDKANASLIAIARCFPLDYFTVDDWNCE